MKKFIYLLLVFLLFLQNIYANQTIKVYKSFSQIESFLIPRGDTTLLINFWASWCKPCVEELPAIEKVRKEFTNEKVKFLLISLDDPSKIEKMVIPLLQRLHIEAEVILLDDINYNSWIDRIDPSWSGAIPGSLLINKDVKNFYEKSFTYSELKDLINNKLIRKL